MQRQKQVRVIIDYTNYLFFSVTVIAALVFLLDATKSCNTAIDFCTISIFLLVFTLSMAMLLLLALLTGNFSFNVNENQKRGGAFKYSSVTVFFLQTVDLKQIILILAGLLGVFLLSYIAVIFSNPLLGIFGSGLVMSSIFLVTNSAMPVIVIHGLYNAIVVYLRSQNLSFLSTSPINIPEISFQFFDQRVINEMLTQILLVAPAEELFVIFMTTVFIIILKLKFDFSGWPSLILAIIISRGIWAVYHLNVSLA